MVGGERLRIVVAGMVAGDPRQGGATWAVLQYVEGLSALGHEVLLLEPVAPEALAPDGDVAAYLRSLRRLAGRSALVASDNSQRTLGLPYRQLEEFAGSADLLLNISGMLCDERLLEAIPVRVFLDLDPGFNQVWGEQGFDLGLDRHTHCVSVGTRIGAADCPIPTHGREWIPTLPPVALSHWPYAEGNGRAWTTVGNWRSYGSPADAGLRYGQRAHSLRELAELPRRSAARFEPALAIHPDETADHALLAANGWHLVDPTAVAATPELYADFVRGSRGEIGVAKQGYVLSRSGWFSDRSAAYLASGRPVVAQDTGFGDVLPTGAGLLAYADVDGAAAAVEEVEGNLEAHRRAARELAVEHLDAARVLPALLERLAVPELGEREVLRRRPSEYRTSFPVELLEVERLGRGRGTMVCKRPNWDELDATAQLAKPRFLHDPEREARVYERLLPRGPTGPPRFFGAGLEDGRAWLLVEYVEGRRLLEVGERELWEQAAGWLGRFHAAFGGIEPGLAASCPLVKRDADFYRLWMERAREFGRGEPGDRRVALDRLAERHERLVEALLAMPRTLMHGEFYASNVLIAEGEGGVRVAPLDWELAGPGPGALDLAALVSGWPAADREAMRLAYERALGEPLSARDLELARLQVAIQWLGWAPPEWQPPADQRRDWGAEAIEIAEELEL